MSELDDVLWPPPPIVTARLTIRSPRSEDRSGFIELMCSPVVREYLGGPKATREQLEQDAPAVPGKHPGVFAFADAAGFSGMVRLDRRDAEQPGHIRPGGGELEVSYSLLPSRWGRGYAYEAVEAVLAWAAAALPDRDVVLCTQVANQRSRRLADRLGFTEAGRFHQFEAEQWLGSRLLSTT